MSAIKNHYYDEIEQRALFDFNSTLGAFNKHEAFEILHEAAVNEITWDEALEAEYTTWQYFNIK